MSSFANEAKVGIPASPGQAGGQAAFTFFPWHWPLVLASWLVSVKCQKLGAVASSSHPDPSWRKLSHPPCCLGVPPLHCLLPWRTLGRWGLIRKWRGFWAGSRRYGHHLKQFRGTKHGTVYWKKKSEWMRQRTGRWDPGSFKHGKNKNKKTAAA